MTRDETETPGALTLPGDIRGLLRRGSPVMMRYADGHIRDEGFAFVSPDVPVSQLGSLLLDLRDATGRAHAAWWLASTLDDVDTRHVCRSTWLRARMEWVAWELSYTAPSVDYPGTDRSNACRWYSPSVPKHWGAHTLVVPALVDIDLTDPRLLEDGSRWVDAEALRLVVLHLAAK